MARHRIVGTIVGLAIAGVLAILPGPATGAPQYLGITLDQESTAYPRLIPSSGAGAGVEITGLVAVGGGGNATGFHVEFSGQGLSFDPPVIDEAGPYIAFSITTLVTATTGGMHTLTATVSADGLSPATSNTVTNLYAAGGPPIPATGDLTGLLLGSRDWADLDDTDNSTEEATSISFLDAGTAHIGASHRGRPRCRHAVSTLARTGCVAYRYDAATGLVQIGGAIGKVVGHKLWISGIGQPPFGEIYNEDLLGRHYSYPSVGTRFNGHWAGGYYRRNPLHLVLRRNGTFRLTNGRIDDPTTRQGHYRITAPGRLVLRSRTEGREVMTLAVRESSAPTFGLWLGFVNTLGRVDEFALDVG